MYEKKSGQDYYTNRHSCFLLQYHLVLVTKYRHPVIYGAVKHLLYEKIREVFAGRNLNILELNGKCDHVHILFETDPMTSPGEFVNVLKTQTSRCVRKRFGETLLKQWYWKPYFWSDSYFITTVSENSLQNVQAYIQNQGKQKI
jgi:putative transposase